MCLYPKICYSIQAAFNLYDDDSIYFDEPNVYLKTYVKLT